ncbi:uncharacterized protein LOC112047067 [Bicyclus anynana]|uniref:Uncharacterized protein LOC112047067 n=1 Tax=Bicyclus anynana TaxID=110368 RepID=A0A6J1N9M8_BICAN|nr:uncharacterized protein LOC112047067 [Bicyclus anynana]
MYLASVSSKLLLHDTSSWDLKLSNGCYDGIIRDVSWSDDSKYILQVNSVGLVEILCPTDNDVRSLQHIPIKDTWSASFHRDGHQYVAVGTKSGNVKIWDTKFKTITKTFPTLSHPSCVNILSYNAKNTSLAATMTNGETVIYGLASNIPVQKVKLTCSKSISGMKFHHESQSLLGLATEEGHIVLRDVNTNNDKAFFKNIHASPVSDFVFSLINKDVMMSSGYDKIIQVYDIKLRNIVTTVKTSHTLTSIAMNKDNQVALGSKNGDVLVYDLRDLSGPLNILKGHEQSVSKVAFQPTRKKTVATDISLKEEVDTIPHHKVKKTVTGRSSDIFFMNDTPPSNLLNISNSVKDNRANQSSFLVGLNKSNNFDIDLDFEFERKIDRPEQRLDVERNISKISTPINKSENFVIPSPLFTQNSPDNNIGMNGNLSSIKPSNDVATTTNNIIDSKVADELKEFISDVAEDNKNYFLHIMMALTKQKLYLEKQLNDLNQKVHNLEQNQNSLVEGNRLLTLQVEQLKSKQNHVHNNSYN